MKILVWAILGMLAVTIAYAISGWIVRRIAQWIFRRSVRYGFRYGKRLSYARRFAFFEGETGLIGWRTCLLTLIYYAMGLPLALFFILRVVNPLTELLFAEA
jgi:hypothetical protein